ncbi:unnamed protein product [Ceratitis capitata]|uniref:(Mediterranean fruit fly) hypothetical protein n=1 Tax=Ceratitis capitata TaxID=7213 RepID=A0A811V1U4_CERCA|nr:unnamed protein product [Ceratitis capitata]
MVVHTMPKPIKKTTSRVSSAVQSSFTWIQNGYRTPFHVAQSVYKINVVLLRMGSYLMVHYDDYSLIWNFQRVGSGGEATEIGSCGLGPQEIGTGCQHWHDMINNARKPTAMWHYIR